MIQFTMCTPSIALRLPHCLFLKSLLQDYTIGLLLFLGVGEFSEVAQITKSLPM